VKPTAKMLGKVAPRDDADEPFNTAEADEVLKRERKRVGRRIDGARARLDRGGLLDRIEHVAKALESMREPPVLGVRTDGNENKPSKATWEQARKVALERIGQLHAELKKSLEKTASLRLPEHPPKGTKKPA
jgi:non-ribosomal peptide synthetase component F